MFYGGGLSSLPSPALPACGVLQIFAAPSAGRRHRQRRGAHAHGRSTVGPMDAAAGRDRRRRSRRGTARAVRRRAARCVTRRARSRRARRTATCSLHAATSTGSSTAPTSSSSGSRPPATAWTCIWNASTWDPYRVVLLQDSHPKVSVLHACPNAITTACGDRSSACVPSVSLPAGGLPLLIRPSAQTDGPGTLHGHDAPLHPDNMSPLPIEYYGTDLGWSYEHGGKLHFLFGDTCCDGARRTDRGLEQGGVYDDGFGTDRPRGVAATRRRSRRAIFR